MTDLKDENRENTTLFITEGDSASGSITKSRDVNTQAVFSLRGKPLNCYGLTKKVVYENEEFNLIQAALDIEDDMDNLRYNKIVIFPWLCLRRSPVPSGQVIHRCRRQDLIHP